MAHKRHFDFVHRIQTWKDPFDSTYLPLLPHFEPGAVEKRVQRALRRIEKEIEKAGSEPAVKGIPIDEQGTSQGKSQVNSNL